MPVVRRGGARCVSEVIWRRGSFAASTRSPGSAFSAGIRMTGSARRVLRSVHDGLAFTPAKGGLVGRDVELVRLEALVGEVAAGRGRPVWVEGEPGIGKTALLAAGLNQVKEAGCQLFVARADEAASRIFPLRVLLDALRVGPRETDPARAEIAQRLWGRGATGTVPSGDPVAAAAGRLRKGRPAARTDYL